MVNKNVNTKVWKVLKKEKKNWSHVFKRATITIAMGSSVQFALPNFPGDDIID